MSGLREVLAEHRWTKFSRCRCGWMVRPCVFPEPQIDGATQFEAHIAAAVLDWLRARLASDEVRGPVVKALSAHHGFSEMPSDECECCADAALTAVLATLEVER